MTITTGIGEATVVHRLALGVECRDALTNRPISMPVRAGWQAPLRSLDRPVSSSWPCLDLEPSGYARFKLSHARPLPDEIVVRVDDLARRYVPRSFRVKPWPALRLEESEKPYLPVSSRLLRTWLWPASAYPAAPGSTMLRGRVEYPAKPNEAAKPVRWARIQAFGPTNFLAGMAHADERGEFLLIIASPNQNPLLNSVTVDLRIFARKKEAQVKEDQFDRCADLIVEDVPQPAIPASAADLTNPLLRGESIPSDYVGNNLAVNPQLCPIGAERLIKDPIVYEPIP